MKVSYKWLQEFVDIDILGLDVDSVAEALTLVGLAVETVEASGDDVVFDVDVTTNRPDCLNHYGIARELAAQFRLKLRPPEFTAPGTVEKRVPEFPVEISIEDSDLCPRYAGRVITGIEIKESPDWLKVRLEAVGQRPINNLVDITNYVLFELGQPLHAFDYETLRGRRIVVRRAAEGEKLRTLDGVDRVLDTSMLMICDEKEPVAVGGVMGGEETEISPATNTLLLESAYFKPSSIRKTGKKLGLSTEASYRFERGADPEMQVKALNLASRMIAELCGGICVSTVIDVFPGGGEGKSLELRTKRVKQVLGVSIEQADMLEILEELEFDPEEVDPERILVTVPGFRHDIRIEDDLVEEVARHFGYDQIPSHYPAPLRVGTHSASHSHEKMIVESLLGAGFSEAINYSFATPEKEAQVLGQARSMVRIANPLTEEDTNLRTTLIPSLLRNLRSNLNYGNEDVRLFETGRVYLPESEEKKEGILESGSLGLIATGKAYDPFWTRGEDSYSFFHLKGVVERMLEQLDVTGAFSAVDESSCLHPGIAAEISLKGERIGVMGELHPRLAEKWKFSTRVYLAEIALDSLYALPLREPVFRRPSRFPSIERDLSFLLDREIAFGNIKLAVQNLDISELIDFRLIDLYHGQNLPQNKISLTVRLTFTHPERTLVQEEISESFDRVVDALQSQFEIERR